MAETDERRGGLRKAKQRAIDYLLVRVAFADRRGRHAANDAAALLARHKVCTCPLEMGEQPCSVCVKFALTTRGVTQDGALWRPADRGPMAFLFWAAYLDNAAMHATVIQSLEVDKAEADWASRNQEEPQGSEQRGDQDEGPDGAAVS